MKYNGSVDHFIQHYFGRCDPFTCPICAEEDREEEERVSKMSSEEMREELIAAGCDPDAMVARLKELIASYKEKQ